MGKKGEIAQEYVDEYARVFLERLIQRHEASGRTIDKRFIKLAGVAARAFAEVRAEECTEEEYKCAIASMKSRWGID